MVVGAEIAYKKVLVVRYGITICMSASKKFWQILIWYLQIKTAKLSKFNSLLNFPAII